MTRTSIEHVIERVRRVPSVHRRFLMPESELMRVHRIDEALLADLLDAGLPHQGRRSGDRRYDRIDLDNIGLALGLPSPRRTAMRWWSQSLVDSDRDGELVRGVTATLTCPTPGHREDCDFALHPSLQRRCVPGTFRRVAPGRVGFDVSSWSSEARIGAPFTPLITRIEQFDFHLLPPGLMVDFGFIAAARLADCVLATLYFTHVAADLGLPVRPATGILLARPYSVMHNWLEFRVEDRWLSADPFLLNAFIRWGITDPAQWPANRSPEAVLWRLSNERITLATHRGTPIMPAFSVGPVR